MWMGTSSTLTPQRVHLYKHRDTRRYLYLADDGVSFFYRGDALVESGSVLESLVALGWFA